LRCQNEEARLAERRAMTLTDKGRVITDIHPIVQVMIELLVTRQDRIGKRGTGKIELEFTRHEVSLKLCDTPYDTAHLTTAGKSRF
jgi:hypothetical protein